MGLSNERLVKPWIDLRGFHLEKFLSSLQESMIVNRSTANFRDWDGEITKIVRSITENQPSQISLDDYVRSIRHLNPKAMPIIESHPRGGEILQSMYSLRTSPIFPRQMSIDGEFVHNPIYERGSTSSKVSLSPLLIGGALGENIRLLLLDLYLVKAYDANGQPLLLQYFSGTRSAGWKTWLFPHGLGFQRTSPHVAERMRLNARDFEVTAGLPTDSATISYTDRAEYLVSIKPDFGYRHELVFYCFFFCNVTIENPPERFLNRDYEISRGQYPRRFRWFYFDELQNGKQILAKNSDVIKALHTLYAASLVPVPPSIERRLLL
jgi:hypothetical protein